MKLDDDKPKTWLRRKWDAVAFRWSNRRWNRCDQCNGVFRQYELSATSGDWWLCPKCMGELLDEMNENRSKS